MGVGGRWDTRIKWKGESYKIMADLALSLVLTLHVGLRFKAPYNFHGRKDLDFVKGMFNLFEPFPCDQSLVSSFITKHLTFVSGQQSFQQV